MPETFSSSSLPWVWVIEALSSVKQLQASVLHDVIESAPPIPEDVGMNMREMIALRCLEEICSFTDETDNDASALDTKIDIDPSKSCEDVLDHVLHETSSTSILRMDKRHLRNFIDHRRTFLPKSALRKLKDTILDGSHPYATSLKKAIADGASCSVSEHADKRSEASGARNLSPFKRSRQESDVEHLEEQHENQNHINDPDEVRANVKKVKHHDTHCEEGTSVFPNRNILEDAAMRDCQVSKMKNSSLGKDNIVTSDGVGSGNTKIHLPQKSQLTAINYAECHHLLLEFPRDSHLVSQGACGSRSPKNNHVSSESPGRMQQKISRDNLKRKKKISRDDMDYHSEEGASSDSDGYHNTRINISEKKYEFLSSQWTFSSDSDESIGKKFCMKCGKNGNLLVCSESDCVMALHGKCLRVSTTFHDCGNFYCPFCFCTRAFRDYQRSKKETSLARKKLSAFICNHS